MAKNKGDKKEKQKKKKKKEEVEKKEIEETKNSNDKWKEMHLMSLDNDVSKIQNTKAACI